MPVTFDHRGTVHAFALRPLTGGEDGLALSGATEFAKEHKAESAKPGNPLFDLGYMIHSLAFACVDTDSPKDAREPFWRDAEEIRGALGSEDIAFLHARLEAWQFQCSPTRSSMSGPELIGHLIKIAEGEDDLFFSQLRPGLAASLMRTMARALLASPELRSQLTSLYGGTPTDSPKKSAPKSRRKTSSDSASTA